MRLLPQSGVVHGRARICRWFLRAIGMFSFFSEHEFMPCSECGASLQRTERDGHVCDEQRRLEYTVVQQVRELEVFDDEVEAFLSTPAGRFALFYAERDRRRRAA